MSECCVYTFNTNIRLRKTANLIYSNIKGNKEFKKERSVKTLSLVFYSMKNIDFWQKDNKEICVIA